MLADYTLVAKQKIRNEKTCNLQGFSHLFTHSLCTADYENIETGEWDASFQIQSYMSTVFQKTYCHFETIFVFVFISFFVLSCDVGADVIV